MKKFFVLFVALFMCVALSAQTKAKDVAKKAINENSGKFSEMVSDVTSTLHDDSKSAISTVYNDGKEAISTVYNDGKDLASVIYPEVKSAVSSIAKAIGVAAEHVYKVLVKSYIVKGVKELLIFILGLIAALWLGVKRFNKLYTTEKVFNWKVILPAVWVIVGVVVLLKVDYNAMLMGLINPEFGAIDYILQYSKTIL